MAITYDGQGLFEDGKPWLPVSGEYQYSRGDRRSWYKEIAKMKALGIDTVASYVIWIHHEEEEGVFDFSGNKSLREFVGEVAAAKMKMCLRVGPWVHGEVRNGGFPDWIEHADFHTRCNNPEYLYYVTRYFKRLYEEVKGFFYADGGPIFAVQVENEYRGRKDNTGKQLPGYGDEHINKLIEILKNVGFDVPIYLATGWGDASTGEALPVWGAYCEAPWEQTSLGLPPANGYVFSYLPDDDAIGNDMGKRGAAFTITDKPYPFLTAELGGGIQVTRRRRPIVGKSDCAAIALVKFGSGAAMLGYYVFHGGINPDGKLSTMNEQSVYCDLPEKDYDFQAAISAFGRVTDGGKELKLVNYIAREFGEELSRMPAFIPPDNCADPCDLDSIRYSVRAQGGSGFVFFNNYVRRRVTGSHALDGKIVEYPGGNLTVRGEELRPGEFFVYAFGMRVGEGTLRFISAAPFCKIGDKYVFWAYNPQSVIIDASEAVKEKIVVIGREEALRAYKFTVDGEERLLLSDGALYETYGELYGCFRDRISFFAFPPLKNVTGNANRVGDSGVFARYEAGKIGGAASVDFELTAENAGYKEYRVSVEYDDCGGKEVFLYMDFDADSLDVFSDGKKIADKFYTGVPFEIELGYFGYPRELIVRTYPAKPDDDVYVEVPHEFEDGVANELKSISTEVYATVKLA